MASRAVQIGDDVRVPWGLDKVDGVVEDIYESTHGRRITVRVAVPGGDEDGETITLPADDVELREEVESVPPGAWLTEVHYERKLGEALQRLQRSQLLDVRLYSIEGARRSLRRWPSDLDDEALHPLQLPYSRLHLETDSGREADFVVRSGHRTVLVEAKTGTHQRNVTTEMVNQLRTYISHMGSEDVAGLLVTDLEFTPEAQRLIRASPRLRGVRWRSSHDDKRLANALTELLSE